MMMNGCPWTEPWGMVKYWFTTIAVNLCFKTWGWEILWQLTYTFSQLLKEYVRIPTFSFVTYFCRCSQIRWFKKKNNFNTSSLDSDKLLCLQVMHKLPCHKTTYATVLCLWMLTSFHTSSTIISPDR